MKKASAKSVYNKLHQEISFSGPIVLRSRWTLIMFRPEVDGSSATAAFCAVPGGSVVVLFRGPLPAGAHKETPGGRRWLFFTSFGPLHIEFNDNDLETYFERL